MRTLPIIIINLFIATAAYTQFNKEEIQLVVKTSSIQSSLQYPEDIKAFYKGNGYNFVWVNNADRVQTLLQLIKNASALGLQKEEYQLDFIQSIQNNFYISPTHYDTLEAEVRMTGAAIHFFRDIAFGDRKPRIAYDGLNYAPDCLNIPELIANAISQKRLSALVTDLEPHLPGYQTLKDWLILLNQSLIDSAYTEQKITSAAINNSNRPLVNRLYCLGILDSMQPKYIDAELKRKVRSAQRLFNLSDNGILDKPSLEALNVRLPVRIKELQVAINTLRWLNCISAQSPVFIVNIPSATLLILHKGNILLESKVIVGKRSTPTPTLASSITDVVLYPYWIVPEKIATRELLPIIKHKIGYLADNNMQVLTKSGKIVDPNTINWSSLSASSFPYVLRQSTGCDNSLGIVKLNFYSPYSVYLHDTPWKVLFNFNKRYFSHGCMRVQKASELARFLLKENAIAIDTLEEKGCLLNQLPKTIPVTDHVPVVVLYNTAWFDSTGIVQFNEDIYKKNKP
jgi:L,D-transpeptidase YcbB